MAFFRKKQFAAWLSLAIYVFASGPGIGHAAQFGDDPHDHHGQACSIQHFTAETGSALSPDTCLVEIVAPEPDRVLLPESASPDQGGLDAYHSRAPPHHQTF